MKPTLVVMAAGMGSRYGGLKQIDPVGPSGEIVIDYAIYDAIRAGFGKVVFVIRREIEETFREVVEPHIGGRISLAYAFQELDQLPPGRAVPPNRTKPWGTAHAVMAARGLVQAPFAVINADDFYGREAFRSVGARLAEADPAEARFNLVGFVLRNTLSDHGSVARGICDVAPDGRLVKIVERLQIERDGEAARYYVDDSWHALTGGETASMNMWGFTPAVFDLFAARFPAFLDAARDNPKAEFQIPTIVFQAMQEGAASVDVLPCGSTWYGVTYPEDKPAVVDGIRRLIAAGEYPERLWG